jgi:hypothetical protein
MPELEINDSDCLVWENGLCWLLTVVDGREQCNYLGAIGSLDEVEVFCVSRGITLVEMGKDVTVFRPPLPNQTVFVSEVNPISKP